MVTNNTQPTDRRVMLKVKIKSLMEEARIIRKEENRFTGTLHNELHLHRVLDLRRAARHAALAYAIVRGIDLERVEPIRYTEPNWAEVTRMVRKYGSKDFLKWEYFAPTKKAA